MLVLIGTLPLKFPTVGEPQETTEFVIHSLYGKMWSFDAGSGDDMTDWVKAIENQIKKILEECILPNRGNVSWFVCPYHFSLLVWHLLPI